jgi:hypothetical protein
MRFFRKLVLTLKYKNPKTGWRKAWQRADAVVIDRNSKDSGLRQLNCAQDSSPE